MIPPSPLFPATWQQHSLMNDGLQKSALFNCFVCIHPLPASRVIPGLKEVGKIINLALHHEHQAFIVDERDRYETFFELDEKNVSSISPSSTHETISVSSHQPMADSIHNNVRKFPEPISNLVAAFSCLPGVGPKTALRYVFYLLKQPKTDLEVMARALINLGERINVCPRCFTYTQRTLCELCENPKRDATLLCVIEEPRDISTIEATDFYQGLYHVLGGTLNPIEGMTPDALRVKELYARIHGDPNIKEIILALSPTTQGEMTILYLQKQLAPLDRQISRLARGLPVGATLEFADEISLGDALKGRRRL